MATRQRSPRRPAQRPDQILDAAERLLGGGAAELNMDELAEVAGLAKGTLYHYYGSKIEVRDAVRRRYLERAVAQALAAVSGEANDRALVRLEGFVRALLEDATDRGQLVWALFHGAGVAGEDLAIVSDALRELIRAGAVAGEFAVDDSEAVATFFVHGFFGRVRSAFDGPGVAPAELAAELAGMLERLVVPVGTGGTR